jgi:acetolactate synthase I/II/III large subunit
MMSDSPTQTSCAPTTGAKIVLQALRDSGVQHIFGYPGAAVLPIYDEIFQQDDIKHILVRHKQGAGHAAEGYARSTGEVGVMLITSGSGVTNSLTPLQDALTDSVLTFLLIRTGGNNANRVRRISEMRYRSNCAAKHEAQLAGQRCQ